MPFKAQSRNEGNWHLWPPVTWDFATTVRVSGNCTKPPKIEAAQVGLQHSRGHTQDRASQARRGVSRRDVAAQRNPHEGATEGPEQLWDPQRVGQTNSRGVPSPKQRTGFQKEESTHSVHLFLSSLILHDIGNAKEGFFAFFGCKILISCFRKMLLHCKEIVKFRLSVAMIFLAEMCPL